MKLSRFHRKVWHRHLRHRPQSPPAITWQDSRWPLYCVGVISVQSTFHTVCPHIPVWLRTLMNSSPRLQSPFQDGLRTTCAGDEGANPRHNTPPDSRCSCSCSCYQSPRFFTLGLHRVGYILRSLQTQSMHTSANCQAIYRSAVYRKHRPYTLAKRRA